MFAIRTARLALLTLGILAVAGTCRMTAQQPLALVPMPASLERGDGAFTLDAATRVIVADRSLTRTATLLAERLRRSTGLPLPVAEGDGDGDAAGAITLALDGPSTLGPEGYALTVTPERVVARAAHPAGVFYATQTLRQLLPPEVESRVRVDSLAWRVPAVRITDRPRFAWRGLHLDEGRHFHGKVFVKRFLDQMALHKFNRFHWHLTEDQGWRIEIKKYPKLTSVGARRDETPIFHDRWVGDGRPYGPYFHTQDDIREIVAYAAERFITIVPEIEMPGHAQAAIAAYPWLGNTGEPVGVRCRWGISKHVYNVDDRTFGFLEDVLAEVIALFPGDYVHVGGDECPKDQWKASESAQQRMRDEGLADEHELQSWFIRRIERFLNARGRRLIGWDEILEGGLAPNATVMSWRGTKGGIAAARAGHDVVMSPNSHCYFDHYQSRDTANEPPAIGGYTPLAKVYGYEPIPDALTPEQAKHVLGAQANHWTEYIPHAWQVEYMAWPRGCALAEVVWSPKAARDFDAFRARLVPHLRRLDALVVRYRPLGNDG